MSKRNRYLLIVDGSSLLATSYYATLPKAARKEKDEDKKEEILQKLLPKNKEGSPINAVTQFFHTLCTILRYQRPSHLAICWDISRNTFRKDLWPAYKANRSATPPSLRVQFETAYTLCDQLGIAQLRHQEYEADDFAGSLAAAMEPHMDVRILTRDKDYFQLISRRTRIWYGMVDHAKVKELRRKYQMPSHLPSKVVEIDQPVLLQEFGCTPQAVIMLKSLFGDNSDNIPGVFGMGKSRSLTLSMHYDEPSALYQDLESHATKKKQKELMGKWRTWGIHRSPFATLMRQARPGRYSAKEMAFLCYELGRIKTDINLSLYLNEPFRPELFAISPLSAQTIHILEENAIHLRIKDKLTADRQKKAKPAKEKAGKEKNPSSKALKAKGKSKSRPKPNVKAKSAKDQTSRKPQAARPAKKAQALKKPAASVTPKRNKTARTRPAKAIEKRPQQNAAIKKSRKPGSDRSNSVKTKAINQPNTKKQDQNRAKTRRCRPVKPQPQAQA